MNKTMGARLRKDASAEQLAADAMRLVGIVLAGMGTMPQLVAQGLAWYPGCYDTCVDTAATLGIDAHMFIGIVAALSPKMPWSRNIPLAIKNVQALQSTGTLFTSWQGDKVLAIWHGGDVPTVLGPLKTGHFYHSILTAGASNLHVAMDMWELRACTGNMDDTVVNPRDYAYWVQVHHAAQAILASQYNIVWSLANLQAVIWCLVRGSAE